VRTLQTSDDRDSRYSRAQIIDHVMIARRCGVCEKEHIPTLCAKDGVIGKARTGVRLVSFIATLAIAKRMPLRAIQKLLHGLYELHISLGEITELLHKVGGFARGTAEWILRGIRGSPHAYGDETGWREDGINGYLWRLSTPKLRYLHFERSRAGAVARKLFGACFSGVMLCDFYGGYNWYGGPIQRCWPHFLRDLAKLVETHPNNESVRRSRQSESCRYAHRRNPNHPEQQTHRVIGERQQGCPGVSRGPFGIV
jgi:transposase